MDDSTTYCVYRIVNFRNGKVYIGQTLKKNKRRKQHWGELKSGKHKNIHLQNAYQKYGRSAFFFEVLEDNIPAIKIDEREVYWIAYFDSYRNGYNRTLGGHNGVTCSIPCVWNGVEYASISEAARRLNISDVSMGRRVSLGYTCDADLMASGDYNSLKCTWNGIEYKSVSFAARQLGVNEAVLRQRLRKGLTCDDDVSSRCRLVEWDGVTYPSIAECARELGISENSVRWRLNRGYKSKRDMTYNRDQFNHLNHE